MLLGWHELGADARGALLARACFGFPGAKVRGCCEDGSGPSFRALCGAHPGKALELPELARRMAASTSGKVAKQPRRRRNVDNVGR